MERVVVLDDKSRGTMSLMVLRLDGKSTIEFFGAMPVRGGIGGGFRNFEYDIDALIREPFELKVADDRLTIVQTRTGRVYNLAALPPMEQSMEVFIERLEKLNRQLQQVATH